MKLSDAVMEIEEWLNYFTYDYDINEVQLTANCGYRFYIFEMLPTGGWTDEYFMTVEPNGTLINNNGNDVIDVGQEAYSDQEELIEWLKKFEEEWYRKENK